MNKTLEHISQVFGVSAMTVSNALNGRKGVSEKKAQAIRKYAVKVGYQTDYRASSLTRRRTRMIGMCLRTKPTFTWWAQLVYEIQKQLHEADFRMTLGIAPEGEDQQNGFIDHFMSLRCEAVIVGPLGMRHEYDALAHRLSGVPYVIGFESFSDLPIDVVSVDECKAMHQAVAYLHDHGHRCIGHFGIPPEVRQKPDLRTRYNGFIQGMKRLDLPIRQDWFVFDEGRDEQVIDALLAKHRQGESMPTAWCTHNDLAAARLIRILNEHGVRVPDDVSVIGFDNHEIASLVHPQITTLALNAQEHARRIVDQVLENVERIQRREKRLDEPVTILPSISMVERKSVKTLKSDRVDSPVSY
ncbi:MAG: LacI family DNA-binding transcriptional regulator [Phycisphaeraceae bacterium JB051]